VFLAKFRFQQSQNQISFKPKKTTGIQQKKESNNCIRKFEMLFHEYLNILCVIVIQNLPKQFNAILS
jgi:hypothetical protein